MPNTPNESQQHAHLDNDERASGAPEAKSSRTMMGHFWAAREYLTPTLKTSAFLEKGVLTPDEFVRAGDELVFRCPTWSWQGNSRGSGSQASATKTYLPAGKQYLVTRNVPCQARVASMETAMDLQRGEDDEGDWLISNFIQHKERCIEDEFDILDETGEIMDVPKTATLEESDGNDEYADMADFEDDNVIRDDVATAVVVDRDDNLIKTRTYDLSITYDKYYQTPRVWMMGMSAEGQPLSGQEMMEDVISDYANKTVTIEAHPHVSGPHASIHPCQHGKVMKTIVRNLMQSSTDGDEGPSVEMYIFIFLKFVSSIIPTINYDFTMDVTASTSK
jgi:ubiquitin-like-conjugating enzyme ATG3